MARLFLDGIFSGVSNSPSSVRVTFTSMDLVPTTLTGLIVGDPTFSAQNKWGPIINDISNLTDFSSILGSDSLFSWISASTMCWKGTSPLTIGIEFYLINYTRSIDLRGKLREFVKLASLSDDPEATIGKDFKVRVHGGYAATIFQGNSTVFNNADIGNLTDLASTFSRENLGTAFEGIYENDVAKGSVTLQFGNTMKIRNLLLSKIDVTKSTIEVANQNGGDIQPLYYRVGASFMGIKPLITREVDTIFSYIK